MADQLRINKEIRAQELRVIAADGKNLGVLGLAAAPPAAEGGGGAPLDKIPPRGAPPWGVFGYW